MHINRRHILILLLVLVIFTIFLPIKVRYSFEATAKIYPVREWKLLRGAEEGFWSQTINYETNALSDFKNYRFERGDIAELEIRKDLVFGAMIEENDTVAEIKSYFIQNEITRLANLRDVELANKGVVSTGEKQALIEQADRQYNYALQQLDLEKKNIARQEKLYRDSVIPAAEFDLYENTFKLAEINVQVTYDALQALKTGEKDQVVNMSEQLIKSYEKEIERLEIQKKQYTIISPISGVLNYDLDSIGGILKVRDISQLLLKIPVAYQQSIYLDELHKVTFSTPDNKLTVNAEFKGFDENVSQIQGHQFVIAKAVTKESSPGIYPGMVVTCRIYCDKVRILEYLKRNFSVSF
jgi:multidrug efflux pump subunit AcrA (membrane-fusion protein)